MAERVKEDFMCPNHFHQPFLGTKLPPLSATSLNFWPLDEWEDRTHALGHCVVPKSKKRSNLEWQRSWTRDRGGSWRALKTVPSLCPSTVRALGIRASRRAMFQDKGGFLQGLSNDTIWRTAYSIKSKDRLLDFQGWEGEQRQSSEKIRGSSFTNNLCPFKTRKVK